MNKTTNKTTIGRVTKIIKTTVFYKTIIGEFEVGAIDISWCPSVKIGDVIEIVANYYSSKIISVTIK